MTHLDRSRLSRIRSSALGKGASHFGWTRGNRVQLLPDGDAIFESALHAINAAQERVWLELYIFEPDQVGRLALQALTKAASRGCDVRLLVDRWGSPHLRRLHLVPLLEAGAHVALYNPFWPWHKLGRKISTLLHRDHRKLLLVDGRGILGSANLSTDYGGPGPERFIDLALLLEGPCVQDLASLFVDVFTTAHAPAPRVYLEHPLLDPDTPVRILPLDARSKRQEFNEALLSMVGRAEQQCFLTTPYFVPPPWFVDALIRARQRGVDVRILTAGESDVPAARIAGRHLYRILLREGIRIYELRAPILHAKSMVIDERFGVVGSYNVDRYGSKHNLELGAAVEDAALALELKHLFLHQLDHALEINERTWQKRPWYTRLIPWFLFHLAKL